MRRRAGLIAWLLIPILGGCAPSPSEPPGVIGIGADRLRTFTWPADQDGAPVACPAFAAAHPVSGILRGVAGDPQEPIWLEGQSGTRLSIVWPAGFTASFEPDAVLRDEGGDVVATAGARVELSQVDAFANTGTYGDPYVASGILFDGCYPFLR